MKDRKSVGIVGCGYWGPNLVRNFNSLPNCRVKMMCDLSEKRLQHMRTLYPDVEGVTDYERLLKDDRLDAVVVAAPVKYHFPLTHIVLNNGELAKISREQLGAIRPVWETNLVNPDFCDYARLCGGTGFSVRTPGELRPALEAALAHTEGPSLVEIHSSSKDV